MPRSEARGFEDGVIMSVVYGEAALSVSGSYIEFAACPNALNSDLLLFIEIDST